MRKTSLATLMTLIAVVAHAQIIVDNSDGAFTRSGFANTGAFGTPYGADYNWSQTETSETEWARWTPTIPTTGNYEVEVYYVAGSNRPTDARYTIHHAGGDSVVNINQEANSQTWVSLGTFTFNAGTAGYVQLSNQSAETAQAAIADAVRFADPSPPPPAGDPEVRGVWQSRFQWASSTPSTAQANLTTVMDSMVNNNFNTLFLQLRGAGDTLYPSPTEPWSPMITSPDGIDPGWDPAQFVLDEAHSRGLSVHAYINTHVCWQESTPPNYADGSNPNIPRHIFWDHCNPNDPNARDWLLYDDAGNPTGFYEYYWFNPGIPEMDAYVREQVMHVVRTYDFDGIHFDRIRMAQPNQGKNPIALARWDNPLTGTPNDGPGNPEQLDWADFMRDCVTRAAINITGQAWLEDPDCLVSSAPLGLWDHTAYPGYSSGFYYGYPRAQDAKAWMQHGAMDFVVPQIYWPDGGALPNFSDLYYDWQAAADAAGRAMVPASHNTNRSITQDGVEGQALIARAGGAAGHNLWHSGTTQWSSWSEPGSPYEATAAFPDFPWRDTEGVIVVNVLDSEGDPITDAWVNRTGTAWTALSSADGVCAFLRLAPGTYDLTATHPDHGTATLNNVSVGAGLGTEVTISFGVATPVGLSIIGAD